MNELKELEPQIALTMCKLERVFPPSFFDVMEHLVIHLVSEAKIAGTVQYCWNYFVERNLHDLKLYVGNKSQPEGSISEGYLAEECLTFCSRYLHDIETRFSRPERNSDHRDENPNLQLSIFRQTTRCLGKPSLRDLTREEMEQARLYILQNCDKVLEYIKEYQQLVGNDRQHKRNFSEWFEDKVTMLYNQGEASDELLSLARGPNINVKCFQGANINGIRFHTRECERQRKTQNSGVKVVGDPTNGGSVDTMGRIEYYGVLTDIIELHYIGGHRIILFKCDWFDVFREGLRFYKDSHGFFSLNFSRLLRTDEPFVLACQAEQVFYVQDNIRKGWRVVVKCQPQDLYNMPSDANEIEMPMDEDGEPLQF